MNRCMDMKTPHSSSKHKQNKRPSLLQIPQMPVKQRFCKCITFSDNFTRKKGFSFTALPGNATKRENCKTLINHVLIIHKIRLRARIVNSHGYMGCGRLKGINGISSHGFTWTISRIVNKMCKRFGLDECNGSCRSSKLSDMWCSR